MRERDSCTSTKSHFTQSFDRGIAHEDSVETSGQNSRHHSDEEKHAVTAATTASAHARSVPRMAFGAVLLLGWVVLTVIWVASTVTSGSLLIKGVIALALMTLLAAM